MTYRMMDRYAWTATGMRVSHDAYGPMRYVRESDHDAEVGRLKDALNGVESECTTGNGNCTLCGATRLVRGLERHRDTCPFAKAEEPEEKPE